jgi:hypothetical protein
MAYCRVLVAVLTMAASCGGAYAQARACVDAFTKNGAAQADAGQATPQEVQAVINDIGKSIGLSRPVQTVPCSFISKVQSFYMVSQGSSASDAEYIIYDPTWVREVLGKDKTELTALIGHELGHLLNGDFTVRRAISRKQKEVDADRLAGCAVGRVNGRWKKLEDLFSRIRPSSSDDYPNRDESLSVVREGFLACGGTLKPVCRTEANGVESWGFEKNVTGTSGWMTGGHTQPEYCARLLQFLQEQYGSAYSYRGVNSSETVRDTCKPFNCVEYQYTCTINVRGDPVYKKDESDACPDEN